MDDASQPVNNGGKLNLHYPESLPVSYVNHINMTITNVDVLFDLGKRISIQSQETGQLANDIQIEQRIFMSIQHAKMLSKKLSGIIATYEKDFGEVVTEPKQ